MISSVAGVDVGDHWSVAPLQICSTTIFGGKIFPIKCQMPETDVMLLALVCVCVSHVFS